MIESDPGPRLVRQAPWLEFLLVHLAGRGIRARVELEDLVQEVFLRVLADPDRLPGEQEGEPALRRYLARVARNSVFDLLRYFRQDVFAVQVLGRGEGRPDLPDEVQVMDIEDRGTQRLRVTPGLLDAYERKFREHSEDIQHYCTKYGWGFIQTTTDVPFEDLILQIFRQGRFLG